MKNYEFYLTDDSGRRITLLKNAAFMSLSRTTLGYGTFHIGIPFRDFKVFPAFLPDRRVEVWRAPKHGATMRREGSFLLRKCNVYTREEDGVDIIEFYGRSPLDILRRQHVSSTTLADYSKTDNIDDMMKEIVDENFITPAQTAPAGELSVDGTQGLGPSVSHSFFGQNVLDILKELRDMSFTLNKITDSSRRIFFDVVEGATLSNGGFGYIFRTYADLRGTDRTDGVVFSIENGNLKSPSYYEDYLDSITQAKILNLSTPAANGSATSPDATLSRWNTIVAAQQSSETTAALNNAKANALLREEEADIAFNGTFLDSPGSDMQPRSLYGVDWDLGDLLPVQYAGKNFNTEVETVYVSVNEKGEENIVGISSPRVTTPEEIVPPPDASIEFMQSNSSTVDGSNFSFAGEDIGAADSARFIIIGFAGRRSTAVPCAINSVTIGGVAATIVHSQQSADGTHLSGIAIASVPTGTTATIDFVWNGTMARMAFAVYRALNLDPAYEDRDSSVASPLTSTLTCSAGSVMVAVAGTIATATATWSGTNGPTEDCDVIQGDGGRLSTASRAVPSALSVTATCTWTSSNQPTYVAASFAKA